MSYKTILKRTGRISLYIFTGLLVLICMLMIFINIPAGRRVVKNQVQSYLRDKLKTTVNIGSIDYGLPKWIVINNVYIEDQDKDTLLFGERISVDINMIRLLRGNTDIHKLVFTNIFMNVKRKEFDSAFNFQFVIDAFTGNKPSAQTKPDTAELKLTMDRLLFDNVALRFSDKNAGTDFLARIKNLDASLNKFRPDRTNFDINEFTASGIDFLMTSYKETAKDTLTNKKNNIQPADSIKIAAYGLFIKASKLDLRDVNVAVENTIDGMLYSNKVTHLRLSNALFDQSASTITGHSLLFDSSVVRFNSPKPGTNQLPADSNVVPWFIKAKQVSLNNNQFRYDDNTQPASGGFDLAHIHVKGLSADISDFIFSKEATGAFVKQLAFRDTSGFILDSTHVNFLMTDTAISAKEMYVKTGQSVLQNAIGIRYDSMEAMKKDPANTLVSAVLNNSTIAFNDLYLLFPFLKTSFPPEPFQNNVVHLNTELRGNLQRIYLPYLQLSGLSGSSLSASGTLYNLNDQAKFYYDLYINASNFRKTDLLKFVPAGNKEAMAKLPELISLQGRITGNKNDLLSDVQINAKDLAISGKFSLKNISDPDKLAYDFAIRKSSFNKDFVMGFAPPGTIPENINLPEKISASGSFQGDANNFVADLKLDGSYGPLEVKGYMKNTKNPSRASYDMFVKMNNFQLGKLVKQDSIIGAFTGSIKAKGTGMDYKTMRSDISASVIQFQYNKYNYQNAEIAANFNAGIISSKGSINDSSLQLQYDLVANVRNKYPSLNGTIHVDTAQLQKLNLYKDTLNFSLFANIQANNTQPRNLDINTLIDSIRLQSGKNFYSLDTVSLVATSSNGKDDINFHAPFVDLHANGAFDYDKISPAIVQYINHYYHIPGTMATTAISDQQVEFDGSIKKHPLLTGLIPGLTAYEDITIKGSFASAHADSALNLVVTVPYLAYQGNTTRNANIDVRSKNERLNYAANFDTLNYTSNTFYGTRLNGSAAHDSLSMNFITQDNQKKDWFGANASLFVKDVSYTFRLKDSLLLNYEKWNVAGDNYVSYSPAGLIVHNFAITSDTARIFINSRQEIVNSPIDITIDNFNLKSISSIINKDTVLVSGILDAKMMVADLDKKIPSFTGDLIVADLAVKQQPIGTLTAFAEKQSENNIRATMALLGQGNDIKAAGNYYLNNEVHDFDAALDITKLNLAVLPVFTEGAIQNATGNVYGKVGLDGKFTEPHWKGELNFDTTRFTIAQLGTGFKINKQKIILEYPAVTLNDFLILDSLDHPMKIDGAVSTNKTGTFDLNIDINATDFILLNAPKTINNEFYGFASVDANISVTGNSVSPDIEGDIFINNESDVTIVIPERSYSKDDGKTIVRFIDRDTFDINPPVIPFVEAKEAKSNFAQFLNYNLNIEIQKNAALTIIIDPVTGDEIKVQGDAQLNAGVDPGGNIILSGNYELDKGYYVFNYQFLQRKFELVKGSTIVFAGEPMRARIDITATYTVNASAKDLLGNEVGSIDPLLANSFNQKVPFQVMLYLSGNLNKPVIKFDIQLPEANSVVSSDLRTTIENKLAQIRGDEAATNKQVFSLLLLGRFVGEQSSDFFKGNGNDFNDLARQSVSQFLSSALNEIAGNLLKGIDVDLNLNSYRDYSNGGSAERTDLNVALSKTFLDDRLTVSVGKNFGVQGQAAESNSSFIPDVTIGYKLTKDGKYLLKAYRKNQFEVVLDGYVVETGLGFVVTMDYEKFNEFFRRKKK